MTKTWSKLTLTQKLLIQNMGIAYDKYSFGRYEPARIGSDNSKSLVDIMTI